jgi:hypothetical protein
MRPMAFDLLPCARRRGRSLRLSEVGGSTRASDAFSIRAARTRMYSSRSARLRTARSYSTCSAVRCSGATPAPLDFVRLRDRAVPDFMAAPSIPLAGRLRLLPRHAELRHRLLQCRGGAVARLDESRRVGTQTQRAGDIGLTQIRPGTQKWRLAWVSEEGCAPPLPKLRTGVWPVNCGIFTDCMGQVPR